MKATDVMREEHRVIKRVLLCLTAAADPAEKGDMLDAESIRKMIEFFRGFADRCHHGHARPPFEWPIDPFRWVGRAGYRLG